MSGVMTRVMRRAREDCLESEARSGRGKASEDIAVRPSREELSEERAMMDLREMLDWKGTMDLEIQLPA